MPVKAFTVTKVAGCRSLTLLKSILSHCKNYFLLFQEMINKCATPKCTSGYAAMKRNKLQNFIKMWIQINSGFILKRNIYGEVKLRARSYFANQRDVANFLENTSVLTTILRAHTMLIDDLLNEAYVITAGLQSDPVERHFSKHRRISGGRFPVNLRDVLISET